MKSIIKSLVLGIGIVALASCSDFLDQSSPSEMTGGTVFNSATYTQQVLNKVYAGLTLDHTYGSRIPLNFSTNSDIELVDGLDESGSGNSIAANERGACNYNPSASGWTKLNDNWKSMYEIIENANIVVEGVENSELIAEGNAARSKMLAFKGEALTLRAMIYFDLIRNYGDVPMKFETTNVDGSNIYLGKTDRDLIMDRLITDLEEATKYLPWAGQTGYTTERITKGFAHGLLGRIALSYAGYSIRETAKSGYETMPNSDGSYPTQRPGQSKRTELYELAVNNLDAIIKSGTHKLNPSFENEWYLINQCTLDKNYQENLYEVAHGLNMSGEMGYTIGIRINGATTRYGAKGNSSGKVKLTAPFFFSFDKEDLRRDRTFATYELKEGSNGKVDEIMQSNSPFGIYLAKWDARLMSEAWRSAVLASTDKIGYGVNWIIMRYSDVLLMYAEAQNELKGADVVGPTCGLTARDALMEVHSRAFAIDKQSDAMAYVRSLNSGNDFFDALVNERAWELAGEAVRKYDLIRWGLLSIKIEESKEIYKKLITEAPAKLYYKMKKDSDNQIDMSSICWFTEPTNIDDYKSVTGWGGENPETGKNIAYLPWISWGLNRTVRNRHLLPIGTTTISDSNGTLRNSYGFE